MPDQTRPPRIVSLIDRASSIAAEIAGICLWGIFVLILAEVVARNAFSTSIHFSWDYSGYLMGAVFMLAAAEALHKGAHVRVTALRDIMPKPMRRVMDVFVCAVGLFVMVVLIWALGSMTWGSIVRGTKSATISATPLWIPQGVMTLGCVMLFIQMLAQTAGVLRGRFLTGDSAVEG